MKKVENNFIEKINNIYNMCAGFEEYGTTTEFFDEDGVIIMKVNKIEKGKLSFVFDDEEEFEYEDCYDKYSENSYEN